MRPTTPALVGAILIGLTACSPATTEPVGPAATSPESSTTATTRPPQADDRSAEPSTPAATGRPDPGPVAAATALAPEGLTVLTLTDWSRVKDRLGASELTSESLQTDRSEFWRSVAASTVLLTDGALRAENSRLGLRYGLTQDDVVWEVRWAIGGSDRDQADAPSGLALRLRDDLDLDGLDRAVADGVAGVEGAEVLAGEHLLLRGAGEPGSTVGADPSLVAALARSAESQVVAPGCLDWSTALGVDATVEDQETVVEAAAVEDLLDPQAWGMAFTGRQATVTVVYPEGTSAQEVEQDAHARLGLAEAWPTTESVGWRDALGLPPGLTGEGFRVEQVGSRPVVMAAYRVVNPTAAASVSLAGLVPWAVCSEVDRLAEPTGL